MADITTITIPARALPARGHVARGLLEGGHRPGVLSLAGLAGKARQFAGTYVRARDEAIRIAAAYGVHDGTLLIGSRHCRVWQRGGQPVRIQIVEA